MPAKIDDSPTQARKRILIVEDEALIAYDLKIQLETDQHEVVGQCRTAEDAIAFCEHLRPDIVVMDIGLLGSQNGIEAAREIRHRFGIGSIFISATLDRVDPNVWTDINPVALIRKPYRDQDLNEAIQKS